MARLPSKSRSKEFLSPEEFERRQHLFGRIEYWYHGALLNLVETHENVLEELEIKMTYERFREIVTFFGLEK